MTGRGGTAARFRHLPRSRRLRIGLLGGSFDPPHAGHLTISLFALKRLRLDQVWWLISPRNPLKAAPSLALSERRTLALTLARHPRIVPLALEAASGTAFTVDTLRWLQRRAGKCRFVWLMGADNLGAFHRWRRWRQIAAMLPIAVFERPGAGHPALASPVAQYLRHRRIPERDAATLAARPAPAWTFLHGRRVALSSTQLRAAP